MNAVEKAEIGLMKKQAYVPGPVKENYADNVRIGGMA
jgi:hypothetical protein